MKNKKELGFDQTLTDIICQYFLTDAPILFFQLDHSGKIVQSNQYSREIIGQKLKGKYFTELYFNSDILFDLLDFISDSSKFHLLNFRIYNGSAETFYFQFYSHGGYLFALGKSDIKEMENLREELIRSGNHLNELNRQLQKSNWQLKCSKEELEERVKQRTAQLLKTNVTLVAENREREKAEEKLRKSERTLIQVSARLFDSQEEERKRIALDLHDGLAQTLSAIQVWIGVAQGEVGQQDIETAQESLDSARKIAQNAIEEVQRISRNLRPSMLDNLGLLTTVNWFCNEFEKINQKMCVQIRLAIEEEHIPEFLKIVIFRIIQEAMNNIAKHSHADLISLELSLVDISESAGEIRLSIKDDGIGFDIANITEKKTAREGLGLYSMKERAELSGGTFSLVSKPGLGTVLQTSWSISKM
jgi:signal transduction histidine kinase